MQSLKLKLKKKYQKLLKAHANRKYNKAKKLQQKCLELELEIFDEIHGYSKKTGLEDVL